MNFVVDRLSSSGLWRTYYGFDVLKEPECRRRWVAPDLRALGEPATARLGGG